MPPTKMPRFSGMSFRFSRGRTRARFYEWPYNMIYFLLILGAIVAGVFLKYHFGSVSQASTKGKMYKDQASLYIEEIDRTCEWDEENHSYYDPETQCYFRYNTFVLYPTWQYWYEDISPDYENYGWMEFDKEKGSWIIEKSNGYWVDLPSDYDTTDLWHIENMK